MLRVLVSADLRGNRKRAIRGPSVIESIRNCRACYSGALSPVDDDHAPPTKSNEAIVSFVSGLLASCRPLAVRRRIAPLVPNSLNRVSRRWARPHISKERLESKPSTAHADADCAVSSVARIIRIVASSLDACPHLVLRALRHAMRGIVSACFLVSPATTAKAARRVKVAGEYRGLSSAHASTQPVAFAKVFENEPSPDSSAFEVFDVMVHGIPNIGVFQC